MTSKRIRKMADKIMEGKDSIDFTLPSGTMTDSEPDSEPEPAPGLTFRITRAEVEEGLTRGLTGAQVAELALERAIVDQV